MLEGDEADTWYLAAIEGPDAASGDGCVQEVVAGGVSLDASWRDVSTKIEGRKEASRGELHEVPADSVHTYLFYKKQCFQLKEK